MMRTIALMAVVVGGAAAISHVGLGAQPDPAVIKPADDPSTSPNPLTSSYGG